MKPTCLIKYWVLLSIVCLSKSLWGLNSLFPKVKYKYKVLHKVLHMSGTLPLGCIHTPFLYSSISFLFMSFYSETVAGYWKLKYHIESSMLPTFEYCPSACTCWLVLNKIPQQLELSTVVQEVTLKLWLPQDVLQKSVPLLTLFFWT